MNFQFDITQIIISLMGILSTIITSTIVPYFFQLYKNSKLKNTIDITKSEIAKNELLASQLSELRKITLDAVYAAGDRAWHEKGEVRRDEAMKQAKLMLEKQGLTFDDDLISKTMDASVEEWRIAISNQKSL